MNATLRPRPTLYNGIQMRSRLEASFAGLLDGLGLGWEYEPQAFASAEGQYLPDFRVFDFSGESSNISLLAGWPSCACYVEVKPTSVVKTTEFEDFERQQRIIRATLPGADLVVVAGSGWPCKSWTVMPLDPARLFQFRAIDLEI